MRLYLVRHGETDGNVAGRAQGRRDVPLNDAGRRQAAAGSEVLRARPLRAVVASPSVRARDTALAIAAPHAITVREDARLLELDMGELDGLTGAEMREREPDLLRRWRAEDPRDLRMPGGETLGEAQSRMIDACEALAGEFPDAEVAIVSHNLVLKALLCHALAAPLASFRRLVLPLGSVSLVEAQPGGTWTVAALNACCPSPGARPGGPSIGAAGS